MTRLQRTLVYGGAAATGGGVQLEMSFGVSDFWWLWLPGLVAMLAGLVVSRN